MTRALAGQQAPPPNLWPWAGAGVGGQQPAGYRSLELLVKLLLLNRHRAVPERNQLLTITVHKLSQQLEVACFQFRHSVAELPSFILLTS